jgi:hypothetical protein
MKTTKLIALLLLFIAGVSVGQQPQTSNPTIFQANAKWVNGVAPGYWATAGSGLTLNLSPGTVNCGSGNMRTYNGGTLTMSPSTTNYVYLDTQASCAPAVSTSNFTGTVVPIAVVATSGSAITNIYDDRTMFAVLPLTTTLTTNSAPAGTNATQSGTVLNIPPAVQTSPTSGNQFVTQTGTTTLAVNNLNNAYYITTGGDACVKMNAILTTLGATGTGTIHIPAGTYTCSATVTYDPRNVAIIGDGIGTTFITGLTAGTTFYLNEPTYDIQVAGELAGFTLSGDGSANQIGVQVGGVIGWKFHDVVIQNFNGTGAIGLYTYNNASSNGWMERTNISKIQLEYNTVGWQINYNTGNAQASSFGYSNFEIKGNANAGQVLVNAVAGRLYHSTIAITANIDGSGAFINTNADWDGNQYFFTCEGTQCIVTSGGSAILTGSGYVDTTSTEGVFFQGTFTRLQILPFAEYPFGTITNFQNSGQTASANLIYIDPQQQEQGQAYSGFGTLYGSNIGSSFAMYDTGLDFRNGFFVYSCNGTTEISPCGQVAKFANNGEVLNAGLSVTYNSGVPQPGVAVSTPGTSFGTSAFQGDFTGSSSLVFGSTYLASGLSPGGTLIQDFGGTSSTGYYNTAGIQFYYVGNGSQANSEGIVFAGGFSPIAAQAGGGVTVGNATTTSLLPGLFNVGSSNQFQVSTSGAVTAPSFNGVALTATGSASNCLTQAGTYAACGSTTPAFSSITTGTNTTATMTVGTGGTLTYSGTGVLNANELLGGTWASPGTIGSTTPNTGAFTSVTDTGLSTSNSFVTNTSGGALSEPYGITYFSSGTNGANSNCVSIQGTAGSPLPFLLCSIVGVQLGVDLNSYYNGTNWLYNNAGTAGNFRIQNNSVVNAADFNISLSANGSAGGILSSHDTTDMALACRHNNGCFINPNSSGTSLTFGTNTMLAVNPVRTIDNLATAQITTTATTNKGLVLQMTASQTANALEVQSSTGGLLASITGAGGASFQATGVSSLAINGGTTQTGTQGTDTKLLTAGTISGTGATLCTDANGGATTSGCTSGGTYSLGGTLTSSNISLGTGAGTGATVVGIQGLDGNHYISLTTGTSPAASATIYTLTFTSSRGHSTSCILSGANMEYYTSLNQIPLLLSYSATSYSMQSTATALTASTSYIFLVSCP